MSEPHPQSETDLSLISTNAMLTEIKGRYRHAIFAAAYPYKTSEQQSPHVTYCGNRLVCMGLATETQLFIRQDVADKNSSQ